MKIPKFKPTKWEAKYCADCKIYFPFRWHNKDHNIIMRPNVPFFIPDMKISRSHHANRIILSSKKLKIDFQMSLSKFVEVSIGYGVEPGGYVRNQWWMWAKPGGLPTLVWVPCDE